jgi:hypothetical protein
LNKKEVLNEKVLYSFSNIMFSEDIIATQRVEVEAMNQRLKRLKEKPEPDPGGFPALDGTRGPGDK